MVADAISTFQAAFSNYTSRLFDYITYSLIDFILDSVIGLLMLSVLIVMGVLSLGSFTNFIACGNMFSIGALEIGTTLLVVFVAFIAVAWVFAGVTGSYLSTVQLFISFRKQSIKGFFSSFQLHATRLFTLFILLFLLIGLPALFLAGLGYLFSPPVSTAMFVLAIIYGIILSLFMIFSVPAVIVEGKHPLQAIRMSASLSMKNFVQLVAFVIIAALLALPMVLILLAPIFYPLFYMPLMSAAFLIFYRSAK